MVFHFLIYLHIPQNVNQNPHFWKKIPTFRNYLINFTSWPIFMVMKAEFNFMTLFNGHEVEFLLHDHFQWSWSGMSILWPSLRMVMEWNFDFMTIQNGHEVKFLLYDHSKLSERVNFYFITSFSIYKGGKSII